MYGLASTDEKPGIMKFIYHGMPSFRSKECLPGKKIGMDYIYEKNGMYPEIRKKSGHQIEILPACPPYSFFSSCLILSRILQHRPIRLFSLFWSDTLRCSASSPDSTIIDVDFFIFRI